MAVSILRLTSPHHFEEEKRALSPDLVSESSASSTSTPLSPSPIHFLKGGYLDRFQSFFVKRVYTYKAKLAPKIGDPVNLKFQFPLIPYLQQCVNHLQSKGIKVKKVLLKGGGVHRILTDSQKPLSDLDVTIEIESCKDWRVLERFVFEPLSDMASITWSKDKLTSQGILRTYYQGNKTLFTDKVRQGSPNTLFLTQGAKDNSKVVNDGTNEFGLFTIPALHNGSEQDVDIEISVKKQNSCFCSLDSIQINLGKLDQLGQNPYFESVGGYDLQESLDLMSVGKFKADADKVATLYEGPRGFCRIFTRGYYPHDMNYEKSMWESYLKNHHRSKFKPTLESYIKDHYSKDRLGKIFFLLNYYEMFSRCPVEIKEKESLEWIILEQLYGAAQIQIPKEIQQAREEIETIQVYFYLRSNQKVTFGQEQKYVFLKTPSHDHLVFRSRALKCETLLKQIERNVDSYHLLHHLTNDISNLLGFFQKRMRNEILHPPKCLTPVEKLQSLIERIEDPHFSPPPDLKSKDFRDFCGDIQREIFELLKNKRVIDAYKLTVWALEQKGMIDSASLQWIFKTLCSIGSMGLAEKLFKHLVHRKELLLSPYLHLFFESITEQNHAQKLLELIPLIEVDAEPLLRAILQKYPNLIESVRPLIQKSSPRFHRQLGSELTKTGDKQHVFPYFEATYHSIGSPFFVDEEGQISLDSITFYLERLTSKGQWDKVVEVYKDLEHFLLQSDSFADVYKIFLLAACSLRSSDAIRLISNGLKEIAQRAPIDNQTLSALAFLAKHPLIVQQIGPIFTQIQTLVGKLPRGDDMRKNEIDRILNIKPTSKPPNELEIHRAGKQLFEAKQYEAALLEFKKIKKPSSQVLFHRIFPCYLSLNNLEAASQTIQKAIEIDPENQKIWRTYFFFCQENKEMSIFFQTLEETCKKLPKSILIREIFIAYEQLATGYLPPTERLPKIKRRAELYLECYEIENRKNPESINNYAATCLSYGNYKEAIKGFKESIKLDSSVVEPHKNLACAYRFSGNPKEAIRVLEKLVNKIKSDEKLNHETANCYAYMAECHKDLNDLRESEECFKKAFNMRINRQDHAMNVKFAHTLYCMNKIDDAIKCLACSLVNQTAALKHPKEKFAEDYYRLAQYYAISSEPSLAAGAYEDAIEAKFDVPKPEYASAVVNRLRNNRALLDDEIDENKQNELKKMILKDQTFLVNHLKQDT